MSIKKERLITGKIKFVAPLHIGTGKGNEPYDAPLRRTGDGHLFIPGRAIGGVLRSTATLLAPRLQGIKICKALLTEPEQKLDFCDCPVCKLFGEIAPGRDENGDATSLANLGEASRLWIEDGYLCMNAQNEPDTLLRHGVGIRRQSRSAAKNVKFDHELIPAGTTFDLAIRWVDDESSATQLREMILAAALKEWQAGRGRIGANSARGLGQFVLEQLQLKTLALKNADELIDFLLTAELQRAESKTWLVTTPNWIEETLETARKKAATFSQAISASEKEATKAEIPLARSYVKIHFNLTFDGPFLTNDPLVAARCGFDHAPTLDCIFDHAGMPIISGASLRGVIRSQAEKIARTLAMIKLDISSDENIYKTKRETFLKKCPCCDPLVNKESEFLTNCDARWRKADRENKNGEAPVTYALTYERLCMGCRLFGSTRLGSRLLISDAIWQGNQPAAESWKAQDFLAIDRFTGGGLEGAKFDAAPLMDSKFAFQMSLQNPCAWELGWLVLVLRDLYEGELTLGFGAAKGYGRAYGEGLSWEIGSISSDDFPTDKALAKPELLSSNESRFSGLYKITTGKLEDRKVWSNEAELWIQAFHDTLQGFETSKEVSFPEDSFLQSDRRLFDLYGLPRTSEVQP